MSKNSKPASAKRADASTLNKPAVSGFSLRALLNMFLERWWIGLIIGAAASAAFVLAQPKPDPMYRTEVKILFEPTKDQILNMAPIVDSTTTSALQLNLHIEKMYSNSFYEYVQQSFTPKDIELIQNAYRDPQNPSAQPPSLQQIIRPNLSIYQQKATTILRVSVTNRDPEAAALIANRFASRYIEYVVDNVTSGTNSAIVFLKHQSDEERSNVEAAEREMQEYRKKNNMAALGENKGIIVQKVGSLGNSIAQAEIDQINLRTMLENIEDYRKKGKNLMELTAIAGFGNLASLKANVEDLQAQRRLLEERYLEEHRLMKENALALSEAERRYKQQEDLAIDELYARLNYAKKHEQDLRRDYAEAEKQAQSLDRINIDYKFMEDQAAQRRQQYNAIVARLSEAQIVTQLENPNIKIMDRAPIGWPDNSAPKEIAMQAAGIGLFLFLGIPVGLGFLDSRVKASTDIEGGLNQVLLGGIKTMKKLSETERPNVFRLGKDDALSEAYRGVFSEIEIRSVVPFPKRILITSSVPSEGKSLTASNLAAVFAAHGKRTLLVDCDFRRPTLRRYFGAQPGVGLLPWLRENGSKADVEVSLEKLGVMNIGPGFDVLPAGDAIKNPTEIIDQIAHCDLFNKLSKVYDLILVDTPPSAVFPDALLLSRFCAEMIYVCRFKSVRKALIRKTLSKFNESGISILGVVLNCMPQSSVMNYGYDGYGAYSADYYKSYQGEKAAP